MIIFNGKFSWDGKKEGDHKPISWWSGSHYLTIVDFSDEMPDVVLLKPVIVLAADTKEGHSILKRYQDLVIGACREFNLDVQKVLWVRYSRDFENEMKVAVIKLSSGMGPYKVYDLKWRSLMANERKLIDSLLPMLLSQPEHGRLK